MVLVKRQNLGTKKITIKNLTKNPSFYGAPDWENYFQVEDDIYFPLISKINITSKNQVKLKDLHNTIHSKSYLVLNQVSKNSFKESLKVFLSSDYDNFDSITEMLKLSYLRYTLSTNHIDGFQENIATEEVAFFQSEDKKISRAIINQTNSNEIAAKSNCQTYYVIKTTFVDSKPVHIDILYSYQVCGSGGGSGGGGGDGGHGDHDSLPTDDDPNFSYPFPHCSSFEYAKTGPVRGAIVNNVHNTFVAETSDGDVRIIRVNIIKLYLTASLGHTNGRSATMSASAFYRAEERAKIWFYSNSSASKEMLGETWYGFIQQEMTLIGGTASRNNLNGFTHSGAEFRWNLIGTGNCD
ncbi:hypothetical protein ATE84_0537 [Aquimarina sp. MAR_2010_214]|nr:hypothetical protein ATE84_0537 [Aquimarina sp. MAR_2010_214]